MSAATLSALFPTDWELCRETVDTTVLPAELNKFLHTKYSVHLDTVMKTSKLKLFKSHKIHIVITKTSFYKE